MSPVDGGTRPVPAVAYQRWLDALARAGWSPRPAGRDPRAGAGDVEVVPVGAALGRVSAGPVTARSASPRAACAAMDGIAVRAADLAAAADLARAAAASRAAAQPGDTVRLPAGQLAWIDTGDPLPGDTDTVVVRERLQPLPDGGVLIAPAEGALGPAGQHVRAAGEDFLAGELLVPAGRRLRPGDLAAAAAGGHEAVPVLRRPAVAIIPTGDEIRTVGAALGHGDILDTNSVMLAARCRQLAAVPTVSDVVPDDPDALTAEIRRAAAQADLVLVIAGSSRGRGDHAAAVLAQVGTVAVAGVALRPGHPALLGHAKRAAAGIAPVIGLPGYPLAAAVVFELFAAPLLAALAGQPSARRTERARLGRDWESPADIEDWTLVTLRDGVALPARRGASSVSQLARSDGWWPVPAGQGRFAAGREIEVIPLPGLAPATTTATATTTTTTTTTGDPPSADRKPQAP